jgi:hypothetical protein
MSAGRNGPAQLGQAAALEALRAGMIDLEHLQMGHEVRSAKDEGVQPGAQDYVLAHALPDGGLQGVFGVAGVGRA